MRPTTALPWEDWHRDLNSAALDDHLTDLFGTPVNVYGQGEGDDRQLMVASDEPLHAEQVQGALAEWEPPDPIVMPLDALEARVAALE